MLNKRIKELRLSHGLNQVELAKELSVTKQTVSNWENNNIQPSVDMLVKISEYFSVSTDYMLGKSNRITINVDGLSIEEVSHLEQLVKDLKKKK